MITLVIILNSICSQFFPWGHIIETQSYDFSAKQTPTSTIEFRTGSCTSLCTFAWDSSDSNVIRLFSTRTEDQWNLFPPFLQGSLIGLGVISKTSSQDDLPCTSDTGTVRNYLSHFQLSGQAAVMFGVPSKNNSGKEEGENLLENTEISSQSEQRNIQLLPLILIISLSFNIFFAFFGLFNISHRHDAIARASYETGFISDLSTSERTQIQITL